MQLFSLESTFTSPKCPNPRIDSVECSAGSGGTWPSGLWLSGILSFDLILPMPIALFLALGLLSLTDALAVVSLLLSNLPSSGPQLGQTCCLYLVHLLVASPNCHGLWDTHFILACPALVHYHIYVPSLMCGCFVPTFMTYSFPPMVCGKKKRKAHSVCMRSVDGSPALGIFQLEEFRL